MRLVSPLLVRLMGAYIDRETVQNVQRAGFADIQAEDRWLEVVKLIQAKASA